MSEAPIVRVKSIELPPGTSAKFVASFDGAKIRVMDFGGAPRRGTILIVPGWAEPCEKYAEVAHDLIARGFRAVCLDPRGQGLSQRLMPGDPRGRVDDIQKWVKDIEAVVNDLDAERLTILAHSMGGLASLSWLAAGGRAEAAALSAPATRFFKSSWKSTFVRIALFLIKSVGMGDRQLQRDQDNAMNFEGNRVTSDPRRHAFLRDLLLAEPKLELPAMTPTILAAVMEGQAKLDASPELALGCPISIVSMPMDSWVISAHHDDVARRCGRAEVSKVPGAKHEVLMEQDEYRDQFWAALDKLMDGVAPDHQEAERT